MEDTGGTGDGDPKSCISGALAERDVLETEEVILRERADGEDELLHVATRGEYFGELAPLLGFPRAATARARKKSRVRGYDVAEFRALVGSDGFAKLLGRSRS